MSEAGKKIPNIALIPSVIALTSNNILDYLVDQRARAGNIFSLNLWNMRLIIVAHPEYASHVLHKNWRNYDKGGRIYDSLRLVAGNGLVGTNDYDHWLRQRRMMQPGFHMTALEDIATTMVEAIDERLDDLLDLTEKSPAIDLVSIFSRITMNVIVRVLFGDSLDARKADEFGEEASFVFDRMMLNMALPWLPGRERFNQFLNTMDEFIYSLIQERKHNPKTDFLGLLMNLVDEDNKRMTDEQLKDEIMTMFLAGYETTSAALQWSIFHLNNNVAVQNKMLEEITAVLGSRIPNFSDLERLPYMKNILKEVLRLNPPGYWVPRRALQDDMIDGYQIKSGDLVAVMTHLIHHHPDIWIEPEQFNPSRFENFDGHSLAWMPFGAGHRQCIGRDFALMEAMLILCRLYQRFKIIPSDEPVTPRVSTTHKTDAIMVNIVPQGLSV